MKQQINEIKRMQQLAGILKENLLNDLDPENDFYYADDVGEEVGDRGPYIYVVYDQPMGATYKVKWNLLPDDKVTIENLDNKKSRGYGANQSVIEDEEVVDIDPIYTRDFENALENGDREKMWDTTQKVISSYLRLLK